MVIPSQLRTWAAGTFFGWWIVGGAIGIQILVAGLLMQSYGAYVAVWQEEFGWSKTAFAVAFALQRAQAAVLSPFQGWMLKRFGPRNIMRVGLMVLGVGFILLSRVDSLTSFYLVFLLMALGASLGGFLSLTTTIVSWFEARRSSALALMQVGISIGGLAVPLVAWALTTYGWRATAVMSGLIILMAGLPLAQLMRSKPEDYGLLPYGIEPEGTASTGGNSGSVVAVPPTISLTTRQALRTRAFWFLSFGHALAVTVVATVTVHLVVHLDEGLGYSLQTAATVIAVMTAFTLVGQVAGGLLGDRFSKRLIATFAMFGHAVGLLAVTFATSLWMVLFFAIVHGVAWGMRGPVMQAIRADYFGRSSFATIMGFSVSIVMIGQIAGPLIAGIMADRFGDYRLGFTVLAGLAAFGSIFFILASKPVPKTGPA